MNKKIAIALIAFAAVFQSCKKEAEEVTDNTSASTLFGDWKFVKLFASINSEASMAEGGVNYKVVTKTDYSTVNGGGILRFSNDKANTIDFTYNVTGTMVASVYMNGQKYDGYSSPFSYSLAKTSSESNYKAVGSDSLYFPAGGLVTMPDASGTNGAATTMPTVASGYKYKISKGAISDTLVMTMNGVYQQNTTVQGVTSKSTNAVNSYMVFARK